MKTNQLYKRLAIDTDQAFSACADLVFQGTFVQHRNCVGEGLVGGAIYACNSAGGQQMMQLARPLLKSGHGSLLFLLFDSAAANTHFVGHSEMLSLMFLIAPFGLSYISQHYARLRAYRC